MKQYLNLLNEVLNEGYDLSDRTGVGTRSLFGRQIRFDLKDGFPLLTSKKLFTKAIVYELLWFLKGDTNIDYLKQNGVSIWDEWADENGDLGPVYGRQWRSFNGQVDQIQNLIDGLIRNPHSRRHIVSSWNPIEIDSMALPPCHTMFQCHVNSRNQLSLQLYQRSADIFLGVPFNIASYALLAHMIAHVCGFDVGEFVHTFGDVHLYHNHFPQALEQLSRKDQLFERPKLILNPYIDNIFDFSYNDIEFKDYKSHPIIKAKVAV